jgi:hypothetical protein
MIIGEKNIMWDIWWGNKNNKTPSEKQNIIQEQEQERKKVT